RARGGVALSARHRAADSTGRRSRGARGVRPAAQVGVVPRAVCRGAARARPGVRRAGGAGAARRRGLRARRRGGNGVIAVGDRALSLDDVVEVARAPGGTEASRVTLGARARAAMRASRAVVEQALTRGDVVYGVTTGFGELKDRRIPPDQVRALQL